MFQGIGFLYFNKTNKKYGSRFTSGDIITILYDSSEGSLKFLINNLYQGEAI